VFPALLNVAVSPIPGAGLALQLVSTDHDPFVVPFQMALAALEAGAAKVATIRVAVVANRRNGPLGFMDLDVIGFVGSPREIGMDWVEFEVDTANTAEPFRERSGIRHSKPDIKNAVLSEKPARPPGKGFAPHPWQSGRQRQDAPDFP
jgi:hypothetical protein